MKLTRSVARKRGYVMRVQNIPTGMVALAVAWLVIANAAVATTANTRPDLAELVWPGHPLVVREVAMADVGIAAAQGRPPPENTVEQIRRLAQRAPLLPDPFLINAALFLRKGEAGKAERLLVEARRRDPRSIAARYLLADLYLRSGRLRAGLEEISMMTRLLPGATNLLVPGLAVYARTPGAVPELKRVLREHPNLEPALLSTLAADATNTELVLALANLSAEADGPPAWQSTLLETLIKTGKYRQARTVWSKFAGPAVPTSGIYRPDFSPSDAPPPFNWTLGGADGGVAEPLARGGLRVLYYGRKDVELASQLVVLAPGRYNLAMLVRGSSGPEGQLRWAVRCLPSKKAILELPLGAAKRPQVSGSFEVPASGCEAQEILLLGEGQEFPKPSDVQIGTLRLASIGAS